MNADSIEAIAAMITEDPDIFLEKKNQGLFHNINKRKKSGKSRSKENSTIDKETYEDMKNWD